MQTRYRRRLFSTSLQESCRAGDTHRPAIENMRIDHCCFRSLWPSNSRILQMSCPLSCKWAASEWRKLWQLAGLLMPAACWEVAPDPIHPSNPVCVHSEPHQDGSAASSIAVSEALCFCHFCPFGYVRTVSSCRLNPGHASSAAGPPSIAAHCHTSEQPPTLRSLRAAAITIAPPLLSAPPASVEAGGLAVTRSRARPWASPRVFPLRIPRRHHGCSCRCGHDLLGERALHRLRHLLAVGSAALRPGAQRRHGPRLAPARGGAGNHAGAAGLEGLSGGGDPGARRSATAHAWIAAPVAGPTAVPCVASD
jgi:hypothetical protein